MREPSKRLLLSIPESIYSWLEHEAEKADVSVQNRIRAVLENNIGKMGRPIFSRKQQRELGGEACKIAKQFYDIYATERNRLKIITVPDIDESVNGITIPVIDKIFSGFVLRNGIIDEKTIEEAIKELTDQENKLLSVCDDGDEVFEAMPLYCMTWYGKDWEFYGVIRVCLNTRKTPTMEDVNRVVHSSI